MQSFQDLVQAPEEMRNSKWEEAFLKLLPEQQLYFQYPDPKPGPDKWPYFYLSTENTGAVDKDIALRIFKWTSSKGIGIVINPHKKLPDYVLTYGMIWSYVHYGQFLNANGGSPANQLEANLNELKYGYPSQEFIPAYVRQILKDFFLEQGIFQPRWILLTKDEKNYDLCFSTESLGNPPPKEHEGILEAISWFLPPHFVLALVSEKGLPNFENI